MMDEFVEMLRKRKQKQGAVDEKKLKANANAMEALSQMLGKDLTDGVEGSKKVMVASNSEEGLKEGLEKAEDILEKKMDKEDESEDIEEESEEESEDDLKSQIAMLKQEIENLKKRA